MFTVVCVRCGQSNNVWDFESEYKAYSDSCVNCGYCVHCGRKDGIRYGMKCAWTDCPGGGLSCKEFKQWKDSQRWEMKNSEFIAEKVLFESMWKYPQKLKGINIRDMEDMTPYYIRRPTGSSERGLSVVEELLLYAELDSGEIVGGCPRYYESDGHLGEVHLSYKTREGMRFRDWCETLIPYYYGKKVVAVRGILRRSHGPRDLEDEISWRYKSPFSIELEWQFNGDRM